MRAVITGGGTGGHVFPALAIAEEIKKNDPAAEITYIGNKEGIECELVKERGYTFYHVPSRWIDRVGSKVKIAKDAGLACLFTAAGTASAIKILRRTKPDFIIGTGGFVSAPVMFAGRILNIPCYLHEQNSFPGLVNKVVSPFCRKIFLGFKGAENRFGNAKKTVFTGNPVRNIFFNQDKKAARAKLGIAENDFVVFSFGGSLGSKKLNEVAYEYAKRINGKEGKTVIIGTGERYFDEIQTRAKSEAQIFDKNVIIKPFIDNIPDCYAVSDLIICRAGALSLAELSAAGRPAIIVPYPYASENHQYYNAKELSDKGGAILIEEDEYNFDVFAAHIEELEKDSAKLAEMGRLIREALPADAAEKIYREIAASYGEYGKKRD